MKTVVIGKIVKPQGIKGEVKVMPLTDDPLRFRALKRVMMNGVEYDVENVRVNGNDVFLLLKSINDRNAAEALRGKDVEIFPQDSIVPQEGRYFIKDFIGMKLVDELGTAYGTITDILQYGSADIILLDTGVMIPYLAALEKEVDLENKVFVAYCEVLKQTAVFE